MASSRFHVCLCLFLCLCVHVHDGCFLWVSHVHDGCFLWVSRPSTSPLSNTHDLDEAQASRAACLPIFACPGFGTLTSLCVLPPPQVARLWIEPMRDIGARRVSNGLNEPPCAAQTRSEKICGDSRGLGQLRRARWLGWMMRGEGGSRASPGFSARRGVRSYTLPKKVTQQSSCCE